MKNLPYPGAREVTAYGRAKPAAEVRSAYGRKREFFGHEIEVGREQRPAEVATPAGTSARESELLGDLTALESAGYARGVSTSLWLSTVSDGFGQEEYLRRLEREAELTRRKKANLAENAGSLPAESGGRVGRVFLTEPGPSVEDKS